MDTNDDKSLKEMLEQFSDDQLRTELQRRHDEHVNKVYQARLRYGFGRDS